MLCPRKKVLCWSGYLALGEDINSDVPRLALLRVWGSTPVRRYGKCAALRDQWVRHPFLDCSSKAARLSWIQSTGISLALLVPDADSTYHTAAALLHLHYGRTTYMVVLHLEYLVPCGLGSYMLLL